MKNTMEMESENNPMCCFHWNFVVNGAL